MGTKLLRIETDQNRHGPWSKRAVTKTTRVQNDLEPKNQGSVTIRARKDPGSKRPVAEMTMDRLDQGLDRKDPEAGRNNPRGRNDQGSNKPGNETIRGRNDTRTKRTGI